MYGQNNQAFGGFGQQQQFQGGMYAPGYQYVQKPQAKMTQPLTKEQINKLRNSGGTFDLQVNQTDLLKAVCTHRDQGNIVLVSNDDGSVTCPICNETFNIVTAGQDEVAEAVRLVKDVMQTTKTMYLDIPEDVASQYFQVLPIIDKLPKLYQIAIANFNKYDANNNVMQGNSLYGFNALNALTSPMYANMGMPQQQMAPNYGGMYGGVPNQGYVQQPNYAFQQQPMMGGNPFVYGQPDQSQMNYAAQQQAQQQAMQQQMAQQQVQQQAQPTSTPSATQPQQVVNTKTFNV